MFRSLSDNSLNDPQVEELESHDLTGKLIIPFCTSGGSGIDETMPTYLHSCDGLAVYEERRISGIMEAASGWDFVDGNKIVLLGTSQGGITSAIAAARHTDRISGLVLMYPAFLVGDAVHEQFDSLEEVPDSFQFNWITAGRPYVEDMWDYDVYEEIGNYTDKVLLMHGSVDGIVPISYSDRVAGIYEDAEYYVIDGAGHGFHGNAFDEAVRHIFDYLQEIEIIHTTQSAEIK